MESTLTAKHPFVASAPDTGLLRLIHTSTIGGSADTDEKALTVTPKRPAVPSVVTMFTPVTVPRMASTNLAADTGPGKRSAGCRRCDGLPTK